MFQNDAILHSLSNVYDVPFGICKSPPPRMRQSFALFAVGRRRLTVTRLICLVHVILTIFCIVHEEKKEKIDEADVGNCCSSLLCLSILFGNKSTLPPIEGKFTYMAFDTTYELRHWFENIILLVKTKSPPPWRIIRSGIHTKVQFWITYNILIKEVLHYSLLFLCVLNCNYPWNQKKKKIRSSFNFQRMFLFSLLLFPYNV